MGKVLGSKTLMCSNFCSSGCCSNMILAGAEDVQIARMGQFAVVPGVAQNNRPVYKNSHNQYLYYWLTDAYQSWLVGPNYNTSSAGVTSKPLENTLCPTDATPPWRAYSSGSWNNRADITADCGMHQPTRGWDRLHLSPPPPLKEEGGQVGWLRGKKQKALIGVKTVLGL